LVISDTLKLQGQEKIEFPLAGGERFVEIRVDMARNVEKLLRCFV